MTQHKQLTEKIAVDVEALLDIQTATKGDCVTRMTLHRDRLIIHFAPIIEGTAATVHKTVDLFDLIDDWQQ